MPDLTVTLIQSNLHWENPEANLKMFDQKIDKVAHETELIVLPEMFTTGFSMNAEKLAEKMDGKTVEWMKQKAGEKNIVLTGSLIIEEDGRYFNRLLWVLPNKEIAYYDKRHLFSYADEQKFYTPGKKRLIAQVNGWKIGLCICYDLRFPVWLRQPSEPEKRFDLLICVADWPASRALAWNTLLQARAIENQCFVAGVNRTGKDGNGIAYEGDSCLIDPQGTVIKKKHQEETLITRTLPKNKIKETRDRYPFLEDADRFVIT